MRKVSGIILIIILLIGSITLAACSSANSQTSPTITSAPPTETQASNTGISVATSEPSSSPAKTPASVNVTPAPDFKLQDLNDQTVTLSSFLGKAVLMNFWTTTCGPCVKEMPELEALYQDWSGRDDVALLTIDIGEGAGTVKNFIQNYGYTFPVLLDSELKVAEKYRIQYTPTTVIIGKDGAAKVKIIGAFKDKEAIMKAIGEYVGE